MKKLIVASSNKGKLKEIAEIFKGLYEVVPMSLMGYNKEIVEDGKTFYENALIKAKTVSLALNEDVLSDDSGLMVEALNGEPGIYSARYAGEHGDDKANRDCLLSKLKGINNRRAKFVSAVVLYKKDGSVLSGYGETYGEILYGEEGTNGFGYDCIFKSDDLNKSFGVATDEEKNSVSHRYRALCDLRKNYNG